MAPEPPPGPSDDESAGTARRFAAGQSLDAAGPGPELATALAGAQAGLESLDDDALAGFLGGCQKIAAWASGILLDGIAEFATRRPDDSTPGRAALYAASAKKAEAARAAGEPADPPPWDEFTADELMPLLRLSQGGAGRQVGLGMTLRYRLRRTLNAMLEGRIDPIRARIIAVPGELGDDEAGPDDGGWENRDEWPAMDAWVMDHHGGSGDPGAMAGADPSCGSGGPGDRGRERRQAGKRRGKRIKARINLTIPVKTLLELGSAPGDAGPFGPLDPAVARELARTAAAHPDTRWCLTLTGQDGRAVAHGCARGPRPWAGQHPRAGPGARAGPGPRDGPGSRDGLAGPCDTRGLVTRFLAGLRITLSPIADVHCDHRDAEPGYAPSRRLRHKIHARTPTCSYWECRRPAAQCDDDHTSAWQAGGLTCECNLAPLCRRHHRMKQRQGWRLEQPAPGTMIWHTPAGRTYTTTPAQYTS